MNEDRHTVRMARSRVVQAVLLKLRQTQSEGFTLLEAIAAVVLIGILAAIAAPRWQALIETQRLNSARSQAVTALNEAKTRAKRQHAAYEVGFRQQDQQAQWAVYPVGADPSKQDWQNLQDGVKLLERPDTTMARRDGIYRIQFNHKGETNGQLGKVTFGATSGSAVKRCAIVSNLLGTVREGENQPRERNNSCQ